MTAAQKLLQGFAAQLSEHFDSVQIIATIRTENEGTSLQHAGVGNHFARIGSVEAWLDAQELAEDEEDEEDEEEE